MERSVGFCRGSRVEGRGSRVEGRGSRVEGRGSRVEGRGSRVEGRGSRVEGRGSRVEGRGSRVEGRGSRVEGRGSRVEGRGSRVEGRGSRVIFEKKLILKILVILIKYITPVCAVHHLSTLSPYACLLAFEVIFLGFLLSFSPYRKKSRSSRVRSYLQSAWGRRLLLRLGGKGLINRNAEPEEDGLRLSEESPV